MQEALMELAVVLIVFFAPTLLLGAGLEWLARREPSWAGIKFYVSDWDVLELGSDGDDAKLADPLAPWPVNRHQSADSTSGAFPRGSVSGGVYVPGRAHDAVGHQASHTYLGGQGHEAVSLQMFGRLFDGGAGNHTRSGGQASGEDPGSNLFDARHHASDGLASG